MGHLHLAAGELAGAGAADALTAGVRRVEPGVEQHVEHPGAGGHGSPVAAPSSTVTASVAAGRRPAGSPSNGFSASDRNRSTWTRLAGTPSWPSAARTEVS